MKYEQVTDSVTLLKMNQGSNIVCIALEDEFNKILKENTLYSLINPYIILINHKTFFYKIKHWRLIMCLIKEK